jgi:hypothetical protein
MNISDKNIREVRAVADRDHKEKQRELLEEILPKQVIDRIYSDMEYARIAKDINETSHIAYELCLFLFGKAEKIICKK